MEPSALTKSRINRIAKGSGTTPEDVKELISHVKKMKKLFKKLGSSGMENMAKKMMGGKNIDMSKFKDMDMSKLEQMTKNMKFT